MTASTTVCVIGGGLSGLVAAHSLVTRSPGLDVVVLEASERFGGALRTDTIEGIPVEAGADSFLTRVPDAEELCATLGLGGDLIAPAIFGASIWSRGTLARLPADFVFGMPASARDALAASHLSAWGRARAAVEPLLPGRRVEDDVAVGELIRRRFGTEVLRRSVDPLLAGTRAGRPEEIGLQAALPQVWAAVRGRRSVARALAAARSSGAIAPGPPPFKSVTGGLERIVDALVEQAKGAEFRAGARVETIEPLGDGFVTRTTAGDVEARAVIAALPAHESARVLRSARPGAARLLDLINAASVATIILVYDVTKKMPPLPGSGLLVPSAEGTTMSACTWYSVKWPHAAPPDGGLIVRCFVGRSDRSRWLDLGDDELVARVAREVHDAVGLPPKPRDARVTRWERALPQYGVGHLHVVDEIESALANAPGAWVTGASYRGSGIPDCVRHARATAARVLEWLEP